jgi:hypothetical protein
VLVETTPSVAAGAYLNFILTGTSRITPYPSASTRLQAAVPVNLGMAFYDLVGNKRALLDLIWRYEHSLRVEIQPLRVKVIRAMSMPGTTAMHPRSSHTGRSALCC